MSKQTHPLRGSANTGSSVATGIKSFKARVTRDVSDANIAIPNTSSRLQRKSRNSVRWKKTNTAGLLEQG